jgi:hypothetical protein
MTQVRERAEAMVRTAAGRYPREVFAGGIGAWCLVGQVSPGSPVKVDSAEIEPMVVRG